MIGRTGYRDLVTLATGAGEPGSMPRRPRLLRHVGGRLLLLITVLVAVGARSTVRHETWTVQLVVVMGVLPIALVVARPLIGWRVLWVHALLSEFFPASRVAPWPWAPTANLAAVGVLFAVGATQRVGVIVGVWAATSVLIVCEVDQNNAPGDVILVTVLLLAGDQVRRRGRYRRELATATERGTVLAERARIARELHDVVAHHMSMIAVRAETAPYRLTDTNESAREEFGQISTAAREGLVEMRRLLGVLRSDQQEPPTLPQPGLAEVVDLVASGRAAGAAITYEPLHDPTGLTPAVELMAHRIVQEALSNAARHAPGAPATVTLTRTQSALTVCVHNGPSPHSPAEAGPGHGLLGMRERATMLGGELTAGPAPEGGFTVRAEVPLTGQDDAS